MPHDKSLTCTPTQRCGRVGCWFCDETPTPSRVRRRRDRVLRLLNIVRAVHSDRDGVNPSDDPNVN